MNHISREGERKVFKLTPLIFREIVWVGWVQHLLFRFTLMGRPMLRTVTITI